MKKVLVFVLLLIMVVPSAALAHSGRTDSNGGHNCSAKSKAKGLCSGYHYHNGGGSSSSSSDSSSSSSSSSHSSNGTSTSAKSGVKSTSSKSKSSTVQYKSASTSIYLNNERLAFNNAPIVINDTTLVPLKAVADAVGASVQYDAKNKVIQLKKSDKSVVLVVNSKTMKVNNVASTLNVAPVIYKGTTYVPIKVFSLGLGISISYDSFLDRINIAS
ncbi:copper amine oxidase N-terminal domain-containing protein [Cohnella sp. GbtcB17]|uniref:copper amine oxidase N-terminal domain-containing protein n=1 Tax=Cohnella sp. GbtcB17 TaxID=2824762 RepID=UPI001C2F37F6